MLRYSTGELVCPVGLDAIDEAYYAPAFAPIIPLATLPWLAKPSRPKGG